MNFFQFSLEQFITSLSCQLQIQRPRSQNYIIFCWSFPYQHLVLVRGRSTDCSGRKVWLKNLRREQLSQFKNYQKSNWEFCLLSKSVFCKYCLYKDYLSVDLYYCSIDKLRTKEQEYRRIRLRGKFDHSEEIHVLPRSLNEGPHGGGGLGQRPKSGAHIITPFDLSETG